MTFSANPLLKKTQKEIQKILKKNNILGIVVLADGKGGGDWAFNLKDPEWSNLRYITLDGGVKIIGTKTDIKENLEGTEKSVNTITVIQRTLAHFWMTFNGIKKECDDLLKASKSNGNILVGKFGKPGCPQCNKGICICLTPA